MSEAVTYIKINQLMFTRIKTCVSDLAEFKYGFPSVWVMDSEGSFFNFKHLVISVFRC